MPSSNLPATSRENENIWPTPTISSLNNKQLALFYGYSQIPSNYIIDHILAVRTKAWEIHPRPYIGQLRFLDLTLSASPSYPKILNLLNNDSDAKLLDLGCCFGQDIRKLIHDGLGFDCFLDRGKIGATFLIANIFDLESPLKALEGKMSVVSTGLFLHQFNIDEQRVACERIVALLKPEKGALVVGQQVGSLTLSDVAFRGGKSVTRHCEETFRELWEEVGEKTGSRWTVSAKLDEGLGWNIGEGTGAWDDPDTRRLCFEVKRLA
ncbi:hypothetical protein VTL71DRAFT_747 [Oculimacula yallundae]|uniref:Methyltransferase domain-containing protein n=1 Tax=Oculimacula yallundae TaxID=86028 RepID=A0ABR4D0Y6_9HELO